MKSSRIVAAALAVVITVSIFALPSLIRGVDSLLDLGTFYFFVIDESQPAEKK